MHADKSSVDHGCMPQQIKPLNSLPPSKVSGADELKAAHVQLTAKYEVHNLEDPESKRLYVISLFSKILLGLIYICDS